MRVQIEFSYSKQGVFGKRRPAISRVLVDQRITGYPLKYRACSFHSDVCPVQPPTLLNEVIHVNQTTVCIQFGIIKAA